MRSKGFPKPIIANIGVCPRLLFSSGSFTNKNETLKTKQLLIDGMLALLCAACTPQPDPDRKSPAADAGIGQMVEDEWEEL